jgi:hypothetical protein
VRNVRKGFEVVEAEGRGDRGLLRRLRKRSRLPGNRNRLMREGSVEESGDTLRVSLSRLRFLEPEK